MWDTLQFYAYSNRICVIRKVSYWTKRTVRAYSTRPVIRNPGQPEQRVEKLALDHIKSGNKTTHLVTNKLLSNQGITTSGQKLQDLLKVQGLEFYLPLTKDNYDLFSSLVGKSRVLVLLFLVINIEFYVNTV